MFESSILGIVQGLTEFLPVSSSGHLALFQILMGWGEGSLSFDIAVHFATMLATVVYFRTRIIEILSGWFSGLFSSGSRSKEGWNTGWAIIGGNCITVPVALALKPFVEKWIFSTLAVGIALLVTSLVLWYAVSLRTGNRKVSFSRSLFIGFVQGLAVIPGISRSGVTIVAGLSSGISPERAFSFSFLLSLPAILGANILEVVNNSSFSTLPEGWLAGAVMAFLSGYLALGFLHKIVTMGRWRGFAVYCACIGFLCIFLNF